MIDLLIPFLISLFAGLSTMIGCVFLWIKPKNINKFIGICLSFSGSIMLFISILELIPEGYFYFRFKYNSIYAILILFLMLLIGYLINILINKKISKYTTNNSLYRVGVLSMLALMIHNLPEGILTFLSSSIDLNLGLKLGLGIMLHNIPEGIAIAIPIYYSTLSKKRGVVLTFISGISEPLGALIAYLFLYKYLSSFLISIILLFVSGIMISISINDIFNESMKYNKKYLYIGSILGLIVVVVSEFIL